MGTYLAAYMFTTLTVIVIGFQLGLAMGQPWGHIAWGGRFPGALPPRMRVASGVSILLLLLFIIIVCVRAGLIFPQWHLLSQIAIWAVVAYCALGVVVNAITPSKWERIIWLPVVAFLLVASTVVAIS
jgi:hypothetical protein